MTISHKRGAVKLPSIIALTNHGGLVPGKEYYYSEYRDDELRVYPTFKPIAQSSLDIFDFLHNHPMLVSKKKNGDLVRRETSDYITYTQRQFNLLFTDIHKDIIVPILKEKKFLLFFSKTEMIPKNLSGGFRYNSEQFQNHLACIDAYLNYMGQDYYAKFSYSLHLLCLSADKANQLGDQNAIDLANRAMHDLFDVLNSQISPLLVLEVEEIDTDVLTTRKKEQDELLADLTAISCFYSELKTHTTH